MTDELLPALQGPFMELHQSITPAIYDAWAKQMRAYAREAIRLSHTWPTLRDDDAMTHPQLEGLIRKWRDNATAMRSNQPLPSWQRAEELEGCADELEAALAALPGGGVDGSIIREASEVLEAVGSSGVPLPANWRWPLADELYGISLMYAPTPNPHEADRNG